MKSWTHAILATIILILPLQALSVPTTLNHQGRIIDSDGSPVGGSADLTFRLYANSSTVWSQTLSVTFDNGYYSVELGPVPSNVIDGTALYLGIIMEGQEEFMPRAKLTSVPYAFRAGTSEWSNGVKLENGSTLIDQDGNWQGPMAIDGEIQLSSTNSACNSNTVGSLRWNSGASRLEVCNGSEWGPVATGGSVSIGGCAIPVVGSVSPAQINPSENVDLTINGSDFEDGAELWFGETRIYDMTVVSDSQITMPTGTELLSGLYEIKVVNSCGLRNTLADGLEIDDTPVWVSSETQGPFADSRTVEIQMEATDTEGDLTYTLMSYDIPDDNNVPTLDPDTGIFTWIPEEVTDPVHYSFAVSITDTAQTPHIIERTFDLEIIHRIGMTPQNAGTSCSNILEINGPEVDDVFWIDPNGGDVNDAFQVFCEMNSDGGGWMLLLSYDHQQDTVSGSPNLLAREWNTDSPSESSDYGRDWESLLPSDFFTNNSSKLMVKRMATGDTQTFTIKEWIGWSVPCQTWDSRCSYANLMSMYAIVNHPDFPNNYYFHACDGNDCHGTNTYEAIGVDCHANYTSNYDHTNTDQVDYPGNGNSNCPGSRHPDLWGFGATSPQQNRRGSWGTEVQNIELGRVSFFVKE